MKYKKFCQEYCQKFKNEEKMWEYIWEMLDGYKEAAEEGRELTHIHHFLSRKPYKKVEVVIRVGEGKMDYEINEDYFFYV